MDVFKLNLIEIVYLSLSILCVVKNVGGLQCYQCDSSKDINCPEYFKEGYHEVPPDSVTSLVPKSCDHVFEARYCIKTTGMFEGELGTKRFCSARDWGNYCEWVRRPGDEREYRACVFTCGMNSCNKGHRGVIFSEVLLIFPVVFSVVVHRAWCLVS
ncbi:UPAR/Ly6 domain-containing protein bou isoform X1 [Macrobrachium rosenbergii]|uniref:UPAR/Ly6 domain-containing protein bou isoform X1 n=1 Tax=Macrobrachium rosenbergii TaxID=79674 RepID=UPI0034D39A40